MIMDDMIFFDFLLLKLNISIVPSLSLISSLYSNLFTFAIQMKQSDGQSSGSPHFS